MVSLTPRPFTHSYFRYGSRLQLQLAASAASRRLQNERSIHGSVSAVRGPRSGGAAREPDSGVRYTPRPKPNAQAHIGDTSLDSSH